MQSGHTANFKIDIGSIVSVVSFDIICLLIYLQTTVPSFLPSAMPLNPQDLHHSLSLKPRNSFLHLFSTPFRFLAFPIPLVRMNKVFHHFSPVAKGFAKEQASGVPFSSPPFRLALPSPFPSPPLPVQSSPSSSSHFYPSARAPAVED